MDFTTDYYTISDVSKKLNIPTHVLRFWEKKFLILNPSKNATGRRYYNNEDLENLKTIKDLLYEKGFTISGALKVLKNKNNVSLTTSNEDNKEIIEKLDNCFNLILKAKNILDKY